MCALYSDIIQLAGCIAVFSDYSTYWMFFLQSMCNIKRATVSLISVGLKKKKKKHMLHISAIHAHFTMFYPFNDPIVQKNTF